MAAFRPPAVAANGVLLAPISSPGRHVDTRLPRVTPTALPWKRARSTRRSPTPSRVRRVDLLTWEPMHRQTAPAGWLTVREVAARRGVVPGTVHLAIRRGHLLAR